MRSLQAVCVLVLLFSPFLRLRAQTDTSAVFRLTLKDGSALRGTVVLQDTAMIRFRTLGGTELVVARTSVESLVLQSGTWQNGAFLRRDPNQTRLFFSPTGRTLPKGEGYFSIYEVFFPMLAFGPTDWLTLAGGISLFPGASSQMVYLAPKVRPLHTGNVDVSAGVLYIRIPEVSDGVGIAYGVVTGGGQKAAVTFGLGWGFVGDTFGDAPTIVLGGEAQVSESIKLLSENWFPSGGGGGILSFGIRFFGEHLAGDFGLITATGARDSFPFVPWVGFVYNF